VKPSNLRYKSICLPFESEAHYQTCAEDPQLFREWIEPLLTHYPELFPAAIASGFTFHDSYCSTKQQMRLRRIKIRATRAVFQIRPSFLLPYLVAKTEEVENALYLRHWGVPFEALAHVFGRNPMFYYRVWISFGHFSIVGTTVKVAEQLPRHLVVDEKHTWLAGQKVYLPITVGSGCILGASLVEEASTQALQAGYGEFASEARQLEADYTPQTVCSDGWKGTREAWTRLFAGLTLILCYLHSVLKLQDRCRGALRQTVLDKAWHVYQALTPSQFVQRLRRLGEWAKSHLEPGALRDTVLKVCRHKPHFVAAYAHPEAPRTTNAIDRLINYLDRVLYAMRYFHGSSQSARLAVRALALQWNFHPYGVRLRRQEATRASPFKDLNGFQYHPNWLQNLLIASSMGGLKL